MTVPPSQSTNRMIAMSNDETRAREAAIEAMLQARCTLPGIRWDDGITEGVARIERMLMERALDAALPMLAFANPPAADVSDVAGLRPIDMLLFCPMCGIQHIDEPDERTPDWSNPPHRSHLCHGCGCIWRPADVPTNGVVRIGTAGKADTWGESNSAALAHNPAPEQFDQGGGDQAALGRFGFHPDPAIDFCCEVEAIEGEVCDVGVNAHDRHTLLVRIDRAMSFRVGGDVGAVNAKHGLRQIEAALKAGTEREFMAKLIADRAAPKAQPTPAAAEDARCPTCDGTGDIHRIDGEWLGVCGCPAGDQFRTTQPTPAAVSAGEGMTAGEAIEASKGNDPFIQRMSVAAVAIQPKFPIIAELIRSECNRIAEKLDAADALAPDAAGVDGVASVVVPPIDRAMMDAGERYINSVAYDGRHVLPPQFRWTDLWSAMIAAAPIAQPAEEEA